MGDLDEIKRIPQRIKHYTGRARISQEEACLQRTYRQLPARQLPWSSQLTRRHISRTHRRPPLVLNRAMDRQVHFSPGPAVVNFHHILHSQQHLQRVRHSILETIRRIGYIMHHDDERKIQNRYNCRSGPLLSTILCFLQKSSRGQQQASLRKMFFTIEIHENSLLHLLWKILFQWT